MIADKEVIKIAFEVCNEWNSPTSFDFTEVNLLKFAKKLLDTQPRVPVAWQFRLDLSGPYSSIQGWQEWQHCTEAKYVESLYYMNNGYKNYQVRELFA